MTQPVMPRVRSRRSAAVLAGLAGIAVVVGVVSLPGYQLFQLSMVLCYACALLGLHVLTGICGQINLGQGAFFAVGAYATALLQPLITTYPAIVAAVFLTVIVGWLAGYPATRLHGIHLGLVTLGLAAVLPGVALTFPNLTNGRMGLQPEKLAPPLGLSDEQWAVIVTVIGVSIVALVAWRIGVGRFGLSLRAIASSEIMAASMGVDVHATKTKAFAISAGMAGVGGSLTAVIVGFVSPDSFPLTLSIFFIAGIVVGGMRYRIGALLGAAVIYYLPQVAQASSVAFVQGAPGLLFGAFIIAIIILAPSGIGGLGSRWMKQIRRRTVNQ